MSDKPDFAEQMDDRLRARIAELVYRTKTEPARSSHDSDAVAGRIMEWIKERDIKRAAAQASRGEGQQQWREGAEAMREAAADLALTFESDAFTQTVARSRDASMVSLVSVHRRELKDLSNAIRALPPPPPAPQEG